MFAILVIMYVGALSMVETVLHYFWTSGQASTVRPKTGNIPRIL